MQKAQAQLTREASPEMYAFQERLRKIEEEIGRITASYAQKKINKVEAKAALLPLVLEQRKIQNSPDFLIEQRLMQAYFSSPEYKAKAEAVMRKFMPSK